MDVSNFVKSRNGIGISCLRFMNNTHSFTVNNNFLNFYHNNKKYFVRFISNQKVVMSNGDDLEKILKNNGKKYYSYSKKRYIFEDPKDSLKDFVKVHFIEPSNSDFNKEIIFFVRYE